MKTRLSLVSVSIPFAGVVMSAALALAVDQVVTDPGDTGGPSQLRAKLTQLQSTGGGTLTFQIGTATILLQSNVLPTITVPCTIDGGGTVTISGANQFRIFNLNFSSAGTVTLKNLTLTKAFVFGDGGAIGNATALGTLVIDNCHFLNNLADSPHSGGAIWSIGPLTITNSEFAGNQAGNGGALFPRFGNAIVNITNCTFHDNSTTNTTNGWGGAMLIWDGAQVIVHNSQFFNNMAKSGDFSSSTIDRGGTVYVTANSSFTADNSQFYNNSAFFGGALYAASGGSLTITNSDLHDNTVGIFDGTQGGGAIYNLGTLIIDAVQLHDNHADGLGGAIDNAFTGSMQVRNSVLRHNSASGGGAIGTSGSGSVSTTTLFDNSSDTYGGAIDAGDESDTSKALTVTASTLYGNSAAISGGAIESEMKLTLTNVTITANSAPQAINHYGRALTVTNATITQNTGAGISLHGNPILTMTNTVLASHPGGNCTATVPSGGFNLADDTSCGLTNTGDRQGPAFNPKLGLLQNNGGPTLTQLPGPGSPAIDNGTGLNAPSTDQRAVMRPKGAAVDIGAVEVAPADTRNLANISTRMSVQGGNNVLIAGFIVAGSNQKTVIVRGLGPSLAQFFSGTLSDPTLELHSGNSTLETNDNWQDNSAEAAQISANGFALADPRESGIFTSLPPGQFTAILAGKNGGTGIGLVELYDLNQSVTSELANISTRGFVLTNNNVMIGGFILSGNANTRIVVRGIGPSLAQFGLNPVLADPTLELHDNNGGIIATNDNWQDDPNQAAQLNANGFAPSDPKEAGIFISMPPGQFTAILAGKNGGTGIGLVEIFNVH